jgi:hypothetical protein
MENKQFVKLTEEKVKQYKSIGKASGVSLGMCFYLAHKHCNNLKERCVGYRILKEDEIASTCTKITGQEYMSVEFYEENIN